MLRNQLLVAFRYLFRHKVYSAINIFGLAVGLAASTVIFSWIHHELSYDQHHKKLDRIYRVIRADRSETGHAIFGTGDVGRLGAALKIRFPEIEEVVRVFPMEGHTGGPWARYRDRYFQQKIAMADSSILRVFTLPFVAGDPETALLAPGTIVITEEMVARFFHDENPIGKTLHLGNKWYWEGDYQVTGVLASIPLASTYPFPFDFLASTSRKDGPDYNWKWARGAHPRSVHTFILLKKGVDPTVFTSKIEAFQPNYLPPEMIRPPTYSIQPLARAHLYSTDEYGILSTGSVHNANYGSARTVLFLGSVALLVLAVACINFVNLTTARATRRALEVGLRKVVGAHRQQLIRQYLVEAVLMALLAGGVGFGLAHLGLSTIGQDFGLYPETNYTQSLALLILTCLAIGLCAGVYPAFYLSRFQPVDVLSGSGGSGTSHSHLRVGLVLLQFAISIFLVIGTLVVSDQLSFAQSKDLGFATEHIVVTDIFRAHPDRTLLKRYGIVKHEIRQHPNVLSVTGYKTRIGLSPVYGGYGSTKFRIGETDAWILLSSLTVDKDFLEVMDVKLLKGKNLGARDTSSPFNPFDDQLPSNMFHILLNETAVAELGWEEDPVGKTVKTAGGSVGIVVGVVQDFHMGSLHQTIPPTFLYISPSDIKGLLIRIKGKDLAQTMDFLAEKWSQFIPDKTPDFTFLDENIAALYAAEHQAGRLITTFATLANIIGCLGLIGLVAFEVEQRVKEVGIRRVLGASTRSIIRLFTTKFAALIVIANLIAWPVAWYVMTSWLERFAYRVDLGVGTFVTAGVIVLLIASTTMGVQALRAAMARPVEALRNA